MDCLLLRSTCFDCTHVRRPGAWGRAEGSARAIILCNGKPAWLAGPDTACFAALAAGRGPASRSIRRRAGLEPDRRGGQRYRHGRAWEIGRAWGRERGCEYVML